MNANAGHSMEVATAEAFEYLGGGASLDAALSAHNVLTGLALGMIPEHRFTYVLFGGESPAIIRHAGTSPLDTYENRYSIEFLGES
jgi:hypothetical protein